MSDLCRKICVVGGGPAGLAAAIALHRAGCHISVVDCAAPPIDKACGEGLMPDSITALRQLGIEIPADVGCEFRGIRFSNGHSSVAAEFPYTPARGVRRTVLHSLLLTHAKSLGIPTIWKATHIKLAEGGVSFDGAFLQADLIVGADGQNSRIRRAAGLHRVAREFRRYGFRRHYRIAPWSPYVELHWARSSQLYITPVANDEICVASISRDPRVRLEDTLFEVPEVRLRLRGVPAVSPEMGALSVSRTLRSVYRGRIVLVGDASGSVDAVTGEGMGLAFRQAIALAEAVERGDLGHYGRAHQIARRRPQAMGRLLLMFDRHGPLERRFLAALQQHPEIFESLLAVHIGSAEFHTLLTRSLAAGVWRATCKWKLP